MSIIRKFLFKYVHQQWNIAICEMGVNFTPVNIRWMKHDYRDRWFADPFPLEEDELTITILAEEFLRDEQKGRLAKLTLRKTDAKLLRNQTILDIDSHLSFPAYYRNIDNVFVVPENAASGNTKYYKLNQELEYQGVVSEFPLADPVIFKYNDSFYLLATLNHECNGNILRVYKSDRQFDGYREVQRIEFGENIARRAGAVFEVDGKLISPAQICNNAYGEGISVQSIHIVDEQFTIREEHRMNPNFNEYNKGFHTFNRIGQNLIIDGYTYNYPQIRSLYFYIRKKIL